ncbi:MAG: hypothetical protein QM758_10205 [Armatimonas sp.]
MTQGAMHVRLQTTREAKSKGASAIETLDIILADDMGTRPYELYSGGEAFRVNLALRVALSRTLARRAGAPLQVAYPRRRLRNTGSGVGVRQSPMPCMPLPTISRWFWSSHTSTTSRSSFPLALRS